MSAFSDYIGGETRRTRLALLERESVAELARATKYRQSVEAQIAAAREAEQTARAELRAIVDRQDELRDAGRAPVAAALDAAQIPLLTERPMYSEYRPPTADDATFTREPMLPDHDLGAPDETGDEDTDR